VSKRIQRVNALIKREISQLLLREIEFPSDTLLTVTRVETSPDLLESKVFISVIFTPYRPAPYAKFIKSEKPTASLGGGAGAEPEKEIKKIVDFLNRRIYFLQQKINQRLKMKPIPKIKFLEEGKTSEAGRIEEILEQLKNKEK